MRRVVIRGFISTLAVLAIAVLLSPRASASIIYSICTSGCTAGSGSYATTQAQAPALTYSAAISFTAANLNSGVYLDPSTGMTLTSMNGVSTDTLATVNGTSFTQGVHGIGSGILISLPSNTYAFSFNYSDPNFFNGGLVVNGTDVNSTNFLIQQSGGFASLVSDTAIGSIFIGGNSSGSLSIADFQTGTLVDNGSGGGGSDTPEPSTWLLLGSGLLAAGLIRRQPQRGN